MSTATTNHTHETGTITYKIGVPVVYRWATGTPRGYGVRYVNVLEAKTILGGCRAIDKAVEQVRSYHDEASPTIDPNPGLEGWPLGT